MAEDDETHTTDSGDGPDGRLFDLYETYVGEPEETRDVYLGFGLFFAGVAMALGGMGIFVYALATTTPDTPAYFGVAKWAFAFGMLSVPLATSGVVVLLPIDERAVYATAAGDVLVALSVAMFWTAYPNDWSAFGPETTAAVMGLYALGLALVVGSTAAALVAAQIEQAREPSPGDIEPVEESDTEETYSDEEIAADIEDAMQDVEMSWGGVRKHEGKSLSFDTDSDIDTSGFTEVDAAKKTRSSGVDNQLSALQGLRGGQKNTAKSESTVDDQTAKLKELRQQKRAEDEEAAAATNDTKAGSLLGYLRSLLP